MLYRQVFALQSKNIHPGCTPFSSLSLAHPENSPQDNRQLGAHVKGYLPGLLYKES